MQFLQMQSYFIRCGSELNYNNALENYPQNNSSDHNAQNRLHLLSAIRRTVLIGLVLALLELQRELT
jgi:hypothetical protein